MCISDDVSLDGLGTLKLFDCCTRDELEEIRELLTAVAVDAGRDVCRQDEYGREFFVVKEGAFTVTRDGIQVATLSVGGWFGEVALNCGCLRTASVTSTTQAVLLVFDARAYQSLRAICPDVRESIDAAMQDRMDALEATFDWSRPAHCRRPRPSTGWVPWT